MFPDRCILCDRVIPYSDKGLCSKCREVIALVKGPRCPKCGRKLYLDYVECCEDCMTTEHDFTRGLPLCVYDDLVRKSIYRLKYKNRRQYGTYYGRMIARSLREEIVSWNAEVLIPVPLHKKRFRVRGYNQAEIIAKAIGKNLSIPVESDLVVRYKNTKAMKLLNRFERQNNLKNAFKLGQSSVKFKTVILVDDIYTTGSTMDEISALLKKSGVEKIYFLTIAAGGGY